MTVRVYFYIAITILTSTASNVLVKWVMSDVVMPTGISGQYAKAFAMLLNPWIWCSIVLTFISAMSWMLVMNKAQISNAFPFMSISYIVIFISGRIFFNELISVNKMIATVLIVVAMFILFKGQ